MTNEIQTVTLAGKAFVIVERSEFERLQALVRTVEDGDLPKLPEPDSHGNYPALPYARASLARKIIRRRKTAGLTQADLARRAGIRTETLNRLEKGRSTPDVDTVDKIIRVLERVEAKASP
jgi:DNA-binding XRE family transcriptional regulator